MVIVLLLITVTAIVLLIIGLIRPSGVWIGRHPSRLKIVGLYVGVAVVAFILAATRANPTPAGQAAWTHWYQGGFLSLQYRVGTPKTAQLSTISGNACGSGMALIVPFEAKNPGHSPHIVDSTMLTISADHRTYDVNECSTMQINTGPGVLIMQTVNPGTRVSSQVVFTVPSDFHPSKMMLNITNYNWYQNGGQGAIALPHVSP